MMTRADRLADLCARYGPGSRYVIHTLEGTARKVVLSRPDTDDRVGATGETLDAALDALDAKVPAAPAEGVSQ